MYHDHKLNTYQEEEERDFQLGCMGFLIFCGILVIIYLLIR